MVAISNGTGEGWGNEGEEEEGKGPKATIRKAHETEGLYDRMATDQRGLNLTTPQKFYDTKGL